MRVAGRKQAHELKVHGIVVCLVKVVVPVVDEGVGRTMIMMMMMPVRWMVLVAAAGVRVMRVTNLDAEGPGVRCGIERCAMHGCLTKGKKNISN